MVQKDYPERRISVTKYLAVFSITVLLFISGILFGQFLTNKKYENIKNFNEAIKLELTDLEIQNFLAKNYPCNNFLIYSLGERIDDLGSKLILLENQLGKNDKRVIELKKPYTLLLINHYSYIKERISKCGENYTLVLFFYSNKKEFIGESEKQGYVLDFLGKKHGYEKIKVYSLDGDLELGSIKMLKEAYNITNFPTTIINDKIFIGFHSKEELEKYIS